jgi:TolB protein
MDTSGTNSMQLTFNNFTDYNPKYSTDGRRIAFWSQSSGEGKIWIMNSDGNNPRQLTTEGVDVTYGLPFSWNPDGIAIAYTYYRGDERTNKNGTIWIIQVDTGEKRQLTFNQSLAN